MSNTPEFDGVSLIANLPTGDFRDHQLITPGALKDLPKTIPFKNNAGKVIGEALVFESNGEISIEVSIDSDCPEAKYFNHMFSVSAEDDND